MKEKKTTTKVNTEVMEAITAVDNKMEKAVKAEETKAKKATKKTVEEKAEKATKKPAEEKVEKATKKTAEVKKSAKKLVEKTSVKNTDQKKIDTKVLFQYYGNEVDSDTLLELAKADYLASGGLEKNIKKMELYIKPEDNAAYYVVNGVPAGKVTIIA